MDIMAARKYTDPFGRLFYNAKRSATNGPKGSGQKILDPDYLPRKIDFTIEDLKDIWYNQQGGKCYWLGIDMSLEDLFIPHSPFAVSVERLDSNRGYHKDNIALTTRFANKGRGKYDNESFKQRLDDLLENRSKEDIKIPNFVPTIRGNLTEFLID